ncbi:hypothetical protein WJX72_004905 [[Myrmecia] bisecta]|uniref:Translocon-associated protein subunit beta n=1 Tax=[Myrmecia] bisecta TaxID=41462 RepID=A0AAW1Q030_9CHLO
MAYKYSLLLAVLLLLASASKTFADEEVDVEVEDDEYADEERAFLLVRKFIDAKDVVQNSNVSVVIELYNAGKSAATDVKVVDAAWPAGQFDVAGGSTSESYSKVASGSTVRFQYSVIPRKAPLFLEAPPATVTYRAESEGQEKQTAVSSTPSVIVLTPLQQYQRNALRVGEYLTAGYMRTGQQWLRLALGTGGVTSLLFANWLYSTVTEARKRHKHEKALKDLMKDQ